MREQNPNIFSPATKPDPELRIAAEAAYLVNPEELNKYREKKNTLEENYKSIINKGGYFGSLKERGYEFFAVLDNEKDGFYAVALRNYNEEMLVAIRGTDFSNFNILQIAKIVSGDLFSDLQIALGKIPHQYKSAETFVAGLIKTNAYSKIIVTGHSLGGLLAQLIAAKFGIATIVFDSPGAKKFIEKLVGDNFDPQKITIVNDLPNFINTCGEHVKTPLALNNGGALSLEVGCNFLGTMPHKSGEAAKYLLSHGMEDILNGISKDGTFKQIPIKTWPEDSLSFYISMEAYNAMPDIYDRHIYQIWEKQYEHNFLDKDAFPARNPAQAGFTNSMFSLRSDFRTKYPTFASYRNDFLRYGLTEG